MTHDDDELTPEERREFAQLPRELTTPAGLEDRVVADLRQHGMLARRRWSGRATLLAVAAGTALFIGGALTGRFLADGRPGGSPARMSDYLLLLYGGETTQADTEAARVAEYTGWGRQLAERNQLVAAERLASEAITLGSLPPSEGRGPVGFFLIRAATLDDARAAAAECPHLKYGGTVVIRPID